MKSAPGVLIRKVEPSSPAERAGLRAGWRLAALNGFPIRDLIDAFFHAAEEDLEIDALDARGRRRAMRVAKACDEDLGVELEDFPARRCGNECVFCFIHQNPPGLRRELYFKDGDYRLSFLHGNYITTTNLSPTDLDRIVEQRLSPLYISVHTTNEELRRRMLGVKKAPPILERLRFLARHGIQLHTQIVLCPEWNDGAELEKTVRDLARLGKRLLSIAVVPLGLTEHRQGLPALKPVTPRVAKAVLKQARPLLLELNGRRQEPVLFYADEWHLLADAPWPRYRGVDVLHQLENGVGMLAEFYRGFNAWARRLPESLGRSRRVAALTGPLGAKALRPALERLNRIEGLQVETVVLLNSLFGRSVTVSGLLPGRDFLRGIHENPGFDRYLIPANALREPDRVFLDDMSLEELGRSASAAVVVVEGGARELAEAAIRSS
ncbi:MAG: DUF512 domain-containing protein [Candidatus Sumerlaeota bacterium]|nr:DUF512 domain-containing protein [Candidatus Sumerlaeota bacterium]